MRHACVIWAVFLGLVTAATVCHGQTRLSPTSLICGGHLLNTTSVGKALTVTNSGTAGLTINSIAASGNFAKSTTCPISPSTLAVGAKCTITVTFKPSVAGSISGEITITDNAVVSPQLVSLAGTGLTPV